ncbi:DUF4185 domain-containing protein [Mycobacterium sp. CBMA293]|uniref:DUF4185 domain-containing protein n=2 Tax=Mycolicibacterium TaxID=1866885 RepID=UPI0012DFD342|nr:MULTISPECIES: DUF4185 domain-containing protein [unclassified Mycolicibacterium]MUL47724.1 DUF4185 domain-containing protein [Mycolicibacterium sp. CBMA 360]MUL61758.1 DUF4185 domain-containing protein [Mycolicibacterium sp. CBMA 335]MUL70822.1 DUF4185 domain-containing protein [Mycolicibacterium sp. CBMA 311]MUL92952.1 DUF4185 domain-containing protein [Mycolicibacterium sp. CBMA 230]MUM08606.1 hypothetical protein [Mycolicibacterium sp. CBMA 213]
MGAAKYIGRVGRLAIALGIGSAIASGQGTAWADQSDSGTHAGQTSSSSTTSNGENTDGAGTSGKPTKPRPVKPAPKGDKDTATTEGSDTASGQTDTKPDKPPTNGRDGSTQPKNNSATDPAQTSTKTPKRQRPTAATPDTKPTVSSPALKPAADPQPSAPKPVTVSAVAPEAVKVTAATASAATAAVTTTTHLVTPNVTAPTTTGPLNPVAAVVKAVSGVLNWAFNPNGSPTQPTLAWSVLAFARKEFDNLLTAFKPQTAAAALTTTGQLLSTNPLAAVTAAVNPQPAFPTPGQQLSASTSFVNWVTGNFPPNNTLSRFGVWGTDVGTMWDNGIANDPTTGAVHQVLMAFGDTFSGPNMTGNWLNNILFRTSNTDLSNGISIPNGQWFNGNMFGGTPLSSPTTARQIILPGQLPAGLPSGVTLIPTSGISLQTPGTQFGATQYLSFMSVKQWGSPGQWTTNYSAMAYSTDNGENWTVAPQSVRQNWGGNSNFQQAALLSPGDGYVYSYGTPNGRGGAAYLSRTTEANILDASQYQYYNKGNPGWFFGLGAVKAGWYNDPSMATPVFGQSTGACGIAQAGNNVGELSVQYNKTLGKYVALYADQFNNVVLTTSDTPQGSWSSAKVLMPQQNGGIYAPMMDPWSPSTLGTGTDLYWNLSLWSEYNVMLMKTDLTKV